MITLDDVGRLPIAMDVPDFGAQVLGLSRGASYAAARRGEIPTCRFGGRLVVPVARALELLGITTPDSANAEPATGPAPTSTMPASPGSHDHDDAQPTATSSIRRVSGL